MKVSYSSLRCPHCGSSKFNLMKDDIFLCDYCKQKFNYNLDDITFSAENKIFIEELKAEFEKKIYDLCLKKGTCYKLLVEKKQLANPKKLKYTAVGCLIFSFCLIFSNVLLLPGIILAIISGVFLFFANKRAKKFYDTYNPMVRYYASKIVDYEEEIAVYTRFLSKLTR